MKLGRSFIKLPLVGFLVTMTSASGTVAQDTESTRQVTLSVSQRLTSSDNRALSSPATGSSLVSRTGLGVRALFRDEISEFRLRTSTALRYSETSGGGSNSQIDDPRLNVSYRRNGRNSSLSTSANYRRQDISFIRPLEDFVNDEGVLELPEDIESLDGSGDRTDYGGNISLTVLRDSPVSLTFSLGTRRRDYTGVTDPDLFDRHTNTFGVAANIRFDAGFTGRVSYGLSQYRASDAVSTDRDRETLSFSISRDLSSVLSMQASLGFTQIDTTTTGGSTSQDGTNGSLQFVLARPNGNLGLAYRTSTNVNGTRHSLNLTRGVELALGSLQASVGLTRLDNGTLNTIANVNYQRPLPDGSLSLRLQRSIQFSDSDNDDRDVTTISAGYTKNINAVSSLSLRTAFTSNDDADRTSITAGYSRSLTEDWSLNSGYTYRTRSTTTADADSHSVFVSISRIFELPF